MKEHKVRIVIAAVTTIVLYVVSSIFLFSGINKNFIMYSGLCIVIGGLIAFPRIKAWYVNAFMLVVYLLVVPKSCLRELNYRRIQ